MMQFHFPPQGYGYKKRECARSQHRQPKPAQIYYKTSIIRRKLSHLLQKRLLTHHPSSYTCSSAEGNIQHC